MKRRPIPLKVQVIVLKRRLCEALGCEAIELDHRPPLYLRDDDGPAANNPDYIEAIPIGEHSRRTHGTKATSYGSDAHERAKLNRLLVPTKSITLAQAKQIFPSRALPGGKHSLLKKKLSGKVVRREP